MHQPTLRYCARGSEVVRLQLMLREMDFALAPDGIFGPMTREAVKTFQALQHLPSTGEADPLTWDRLETAFAHKCEIIVQATSPQSCEQKEKTL